MSTINKQFLDTLYELRGKVQMRLTRNQMRMNGPFPATCEDCGFDAHSDCKAAVINKKKDLEEIDDLITMYIHTPHQT